MAAIVTENGIICIFQLRTLNDKVFNQAEVWYSYTLPPRLVTDSISTVVRGNICMCTHIYTGCPRRNVSDFGRVFLMLKYTDFTQNTYVQSGTVTEIMATEV